ncbi:cupin domain-containing protein [Phycisphaerales bacterium AB-hyl4]|uniref:Cupin domain-containing protein n=1 Tax=Natronomicrosphaera hydrolytica TaxID=3242702 RepID=A0ABV4U3G9_9BACT
MPKTTTSENKFPSWCEVSHYGIARHEPGAEIELHFHDCNECWIIIEGRGIATSEGKTYELGPGDMLMTRAGDEHAMKVTEKMTTVFLYGVMPPGGRIGHLHRGVDQPLP